MEFLVKKLPAGRSLLYKVIDGRTIEIQANPKIKETIQDKKITELSFYDSTIKLEDEFEHGIDNIPSRYTIKYIEKGKDAYTLYTHKRNKTSIYILPALYQKVSINHNRFVVDSYYFSYREEQGYFINAYISEDKQELITLYRYSRGENYKTLERNLTTIPQFTGIDNSVEGFDIFKYTIPDGFIEDVEYFLEGKYSKMSTTLHNSVMLFHHFDKNVRPLQVMRRDKKLVKEMEIVYGCSMDGVDLECKPIYEDEVWQKVI